MKAVGAVLFVVAFVVSGCGSVAPEQLPGSWQLAYQESFTKTKYGETKSEREVPIEESVAYVFNQGEMTIPGRNSQPIYQGTYQLDGSNLVVQGKDQSHYEFKINELNDDTLKLEKKTEQGELEERLVLTFKRMGGYSGNDMVNSGQYGPQNPAQNPGYSPGAMSPRVSAPKGPNV